MAQESPYKVFWNWVFDGNRKSPIPSGDNIPDLLKYNTPITATFLLKSFVKHARLNYYLNSYVNNIGIRYIKNEDLFKFIKNCVMDFKVKRRDIHFSPYKAREVLFSKIKRKLPTLKNYEISLFCEMIDKSDERDSMYSAFGVEKPKTEKLKRRTVKKTKISYKKFLTLNFNIMDAEDNF